jgi:L,D-transpeptidase ErfK/SrfK
MNDMAVSTETPSRIYFAPRFSGLHKVALTAFILSALLIRPVAAKEYILPDVDSVFGEVASIQSIYEETLFDIARRYRLGYEEITRANPTVDAWVPGEGTVVNLPTQFVLPQARRKGLVINIAEYRMYYFVSKNDETTVATFPISIGRMDWQTPLGRSSIINKVHKPTWYPPASIREEWAADGRVLGSAVPPGPDNPLGDYALRLSIPGYLIHGTNKPDGVGMQVTHGCIRMFPEDIEWLFPKIPLSTPVQIVNQPSKLGWSGNDLFLEVHPSLADSDETLERSLTEITEAYVKVTQDQPAEVDWELVNEVFRNQSGIPVKVGRRKHAVDEPETVSVALD